MKQPTRAQRIAGSIFGSAYGDAAGRPTEFIGKISTSESAIRRFDARLYEDLHGYKVTDDTMMMLAVGRAVLAQPRGGRFAALTWPGRMAAALRKEYIAWSQMDQAGRAPGGTCMQAIHGLAGQPRAPWQQHTVMRSKGCGANMRVQPIAFLSIPDDEAAGLAQLSAAMTHGHPTALAAADLTVRAIRLLASGAPLDESLIDELVRYARSQRTIYRRRWLGNLFNQRSEFSGRHPRHWIAAGWDQMINALENVRFGLAAWGGVGDPCEFTGDGWVAEEALATALLVSITFRDAPMEALTRAALTRGDSDSLACITGALLGAKHGVRVWRDAWRDRIEFSAELDQLGAGLVQLGSGR